MTEIKKIIVDNCTYSDAITDEIKKEYVRRLSSENTEYMDNYWMDADTYYQLMYGYEPGQYTQILMETVTYDVKYSYALSEIARQENITVEEAEKLIFDTAVTKELEG